MKKRRENHVADHRNVKEDEFRQHGEEILNLRLEVAKRQGRLADFEDSVGRFLAHPMFFIALLALHVGWVAGNLPFVPWTPLDPYPFTFLATVASVEAPFIALLILMHQHRQARINELRDEVSLQIDLHVERKASLTLRMLEDLYRNLGYEPDHDGLQRLKRDLDPKGLVEGVRNELNEAEGEEDVM